MAENKTQEQETELKVGVTITDNTGHSENYSGNNAVLLSSIEDENGQMETQFVAHGEFTETNLLNMVRILTEEVTEVLLKQGHDQTSTFELVHKAFTFGVKQHVSKEAIIEATARKLTGK